MLKLTSAIIIVVSLTFLLIGCSKNEAMLPEGIPDFVNESDFDNIDWGNKAAQLNFDIIGNKNKSGIIGLDAPSVYTYQKWLWHLWGVENPTETKLTAVGYHHDTKTVQQILSGGDGWTLQLDAGTNGADATVPSSINLQDDGKWAILLYTDDELFDIIVYDFEE